MGTGLFLNYLKNLFKYLEITGFFFSRHFVKTVYTEHLKNWACSVRICVYHKFRDRSQPAGVFSGRGGFYCSTRGGGRIKHFLYDTLCFHIQIIIYRYALLKGIGIVLY